WSWQIHTRLHEPRPTREHHTTPHTSFNYGTPTLYGAALTLLRLPAHDTAVHGSTPRNVPTTPTTQPLPGITRNRFSHLRFRSPLLTESLLFSLPAGTKMFHFPTFPPTGLYIQPAVTHIIETMHAGFPHSDILASPLGYQLHQAYRRFPRPSSPPTTNASTLRPQQLTQPPHNSAVVVRHHKLSKHNPPEHSNRLPHENTQKNQHHTPLPKKAMPAKKNTQETKDARVHYTVTNNNTPTNA